MKRLIVFALLVILSACALAGCGGSGPHGLVRPVTSVRHAPSFVSLRGVLEGTAAAPVVGEEFTTTTGGWSGSPTQFTYQWQDCNRAGCASISGATSSTYTVAGTDVGYSIDVIITATNGAGSGSQTTAQTGVVSGGSAPTSTVAPTVTGTDTQADVLTASEGTWSGSPDTYAYQFEDCNSSGASCVAISGATNQSYTLASTDVGDTIRVIVTASNGAGPTNATSAYTGVVIASGGAAPTNTADPATTETLTQGDTLTLTAGTWTGSPTYAYQWQDCTSSGSLPCTSIPGATSSTYVLTASDVNQTIDAVVTATNSSGSAVAYAEVSAEVTGSGGASPAISVLPTVAGATVLGDTLTATNGTWTNAPTGYADQWQDCNTAGAVCMNISGASAATYVLASADVGDTVRVVVTATNGTGSVSADSSVTGVVTSSAPTSGGTSATANIWVNPSGGGCARSGTLVGDPGASNDCGTLQAAWNAAHCGDIINIDSGNYGTQDLADSNSLLTGTCATPVTFEPGPAASQASVVIPQIISGQIGSYVGVSNLVLQDVTIPTQMILVAPADNDTLNNINGGTMYVNAAENLTVENSDFGPCYNTLPGPDTAITCGGLSGNTINFKVDPQVTTGGVTYNASVVFDHDTWHDFIDNDTASATDHDECLFLTGGNITVENSVFSVCQLYAIFIQGYQSAGGTFSNLLIQNNWFSGTENTSASCPTSPAGPCQLTVPTEYGSPRSAIEDGENGPNPAENELIRYNSFSADEGFYNDGYAGATNDRIIGNIMGTDGGAQDPCSTETGFTYAYNVWIDPSSHVCGTGDTNVASVPYVNSTSTPSLEDNLHLACGSGLDNFVTPNTADYQLDFDQDGNARPTDGPRTPGADRSTC